MPIPSTKNPQKSSLTGALSPVSSTIVMRNTVIKLTVTLMMLTRGMSKTQLVAYLEVSALSSSWRRWTLINSLTKKKTPNLIHLSPDIWRVLLVVILVVASPSTTFKVFLKSQQPLRGLRIPCPLTTEVNVRCANAGSFLSTRYGFSPSSSKKEQMKRRKLKLNKWESNAKLKPLYKSNIGPSKLPKTKNVRQRWKRKSFSSSRFRWKPKWF